MSEKSTLGFIDHFHNVIRTKYRNDVSALLHEFGHGLDRRFGFSNDNAVLQELANVGAEMGYTADKHVAEGVAQFFQFYGIDRQQAVAKFPEFSRVFDKFLSENPEVRTAVRPIFEEASKYYHAHPEARLGAVISHGEKTAFHSVKSCAS